MGSQSQARLSDFFFFLRQFLLIHYLMEGKRLKISPTVRKDLIVFMVVYSLSRILTLSPPDGLTPAAYQAPLSMRFPRQEYWSGLLFSSPRDLPDLGIEPVSFGSFHY